MPPVSLSSRLRIALVVVLLNSIATLFAPCAQAQRVSAPKLLPHSTLAYVRLADTPELISRFRETSLGRITQDEQVKPLVSGVYAAAEEAWTRIEDRVGLPLNQLLAIPQGEIAVAFVGQTKDDEGKLVGPSGIVLLIDVKDRLPSAQKLLEKGHEFIEQSGGSVTTEKSGDATLNIYTGPQGNTAIQFEKDGTIVVATSKDLAVAVLASWSGNSDGKALSDNDKFNSIMSRCAGTADDPPQLTWYVDPIDLVRSVARGNTAAQTGLALLPVLGLDGVKGAGGSLTFATGDFDSVMHAHVLLETPRSGVVEMLALGSGDTTPERWVPADSSSYMTLHWDLDETFRVGAKLYNSLMNEGAFEAEVKRRISDNIGVDFESEVMPLLDGRVTMANWIEQGPPKLNNQTMIVGLKLTDAQAFKPVYDKLIEKFTESLEKKSFGGVTYYAQKQRERGEDEPPQNIRRPQMCLALLGDYLMLTDSTQALEHAIVTQNDPSLSLASDVEYKLIASRIKRQLAGENAGLIQFSKPEEGMRLLYDLAAADTTRERLATQAENNPFFKKLDETMKQNPLPPFSVLARYLAPGGGMLTSDETGFHYTTFTLRRK